MTEVEQKPSQPEEGVEQSIDLWKNSIVIFAVLLLGSLIGYFWFYVKHLPPDPTATDRLGIGDWGAFGDFMGGLLNPIVAFAALYWLTQSVKLQKTELAETRKALEGSEQAQKAQADHSAQNLRIASRAALVSALQSQISAREVEIQSCEEKITETIGLLALQNPRVKDYLDKQRGNVVSPPIPNDVEFSIEMKTKNFRDQKMLALEEKQKLIVERDMRLNELRKFVEAP